MPEIIIRHIIVINIYNQVLMKNRLFSHIIFFYV